MKEKLLKKIDNREIIVGVIGLGYVGLPLAVEKARAGFRTIGFDIQKEKVQAVNRGENYIGDVVDDDLKALVQSGMLSATSDFSMVAQADFVAICVPTPLDIHQQPDISYVEQSTRDIARHLKKESMVVLESTTYPGTTEELIKPLLEKGSGLVCGKDFYLAFSPERVDPGNRHYHTKNTPKVVGGLGADATEVVAHMYEAVIDTEVFRASSPAVAEMEKILENTYRNINIGLVNELAQLCHKMDIDIWEVIDAASTKPYGFQAFYPGPGLGGHCIPLDPYYLSWKAREYGFHTSMIESSMMINDGMPEYCCQRMSRMLNDVKKPIHGSRILMLGVAYKQDIDDLRESPALKILEILQDMGGRVDYYDPFVASFDWNGGVKESLPQLTGDLLRQYDLVTITTAHTTVDYQLVAQHADLIFDTKNATKDIVPRDNIQRL